jgi:site-specific DNA recombinase
MSQSQVRAIVGARVSSVQGDEKTSHNTRSNGDAYAESHDWTVVGRFEDLDVSAIKLSPWDGQTSRRGSPIGQTTGIP